MHACDGRADPVTPRARPEEKFCAPAVVRAGTAGGRDRNETRVWDDALERGVVRACVSRGADKELGDVIVGPSEPKERVWRV
jgi:hypothetical protein